MLVALHNRLCLWHPELLARLGTNFFFRLCLVKSKLSALSTKIVLKAGWGESLSPVFTNIKHFLTIHAQNPIIQDMYQKKPPMLCMKFLSCFGLFALVSLQPFISNIHNSGHLLRVCMPIFWVLAASKASASVQNFIHCNKRFISLKPP